MPGLNWLHSFLGGSRHNYWEDRYRSGGNSGIGSYGEFAQFKSEIINSFVKENAIETVIEFGCGDGHQLTLMKYPKYLGVDISKTAVELCRKKFRDDRSKSFSVAKPGESYGPFDLALSLDVIFHLVDDAVYNQYMRELFAASERFVIVYSSNSDPTAGSYQFPPHVKHRRFTDWVDVQAPQWKLLRHIPNRYPFYVDASGEHGSFADFYIFARQGAASSAR